MDNVTIGISVDYFEFLFIFILSNEWGKFSVFGNFSGQTTFSKIVALVV